MIPIHLTNSGPKNLAMISFKPHNVCNAVIEKWSPNYD